MPNGTGVYGARDDNKTGEGRRYVHDNNGTSNGTQAGGQRVTITKTTYRTVVVLGWWGGGGVVVTSPSRRTISLCGRVLTPRPRSFGGVDFVANISYTSGLGSLAMWELV